MNATTDYQNNQTKEPSDMEQDINHTRERIGRTVEELEQRLSPGQLMDQALGYAREHGGDFVSSVAGSVRRNPLPMIVTGLGILWLLKSQSSSRSSGVTGGRVYSPYDDTADIYGNGGTAGDGSSLYRGSESDRDSGLYRGVDSGSSGLYRGSESGSYGSESSGGIKEKISHVGETIKSKVSGLRSSASSAGGAVSERLRSTKDSLSERAHGVVGSAQSASRSLRQRSSSASAGGMDQFRRAKGEFTTLMEEQPLLLGAVGIAIGATIAALVPTTRRERELMGSASDSLADRASQLASQKYEELRETATQTVDEFTRSLKEGRASGSETGDSSATRGSSATTGSSGSGNSIAQGMSRSADQGVGSVSSSSLSGSPSGSSSQSKDRIGESMGRTSGQTGASGSSSTGSSSLGSSSSGSSGGSVSGSGLSGSGASASRPTGPGTSSSATGSLSGGTSGSSSSASTNKPGSPSTRSS